MDLVCAANGEKSILQNAPSDLVQRAVQLIQILLPMGSVMLHAKISLEDGMVQPIQKILLESPHKILLDCGTAHFTTFIKKCPNFKGCETVTLVKGMHIGKLFEFIQIQNDSWTPKAKVFAKAQNEISWATGEIEGEQVENDKISNKNENTNESLVGPPPGFPGPPKYKQKYKQADVRRSPRLSLKGNGEYQRPEEKARLLKKPGTVSAMGARKKRKIKETNIQMEYLKTYDPLSSNQAEVVILAAGVEMGKDLEAKVKGVLTI